MQWVRERTCGADEVESIRIAAQRAILHVDEFPLGAIISSKLIDELFFRRAASSRGVTRDARVERPARAISPRVVTYLCVV